MKTFDVSIARKSVKRGNTIRDVKLIVKVTFFNEVYMKRRKNVFRCQFFC